MYYLKTISCSVVLAILIGMVAVFPARAVTESELNAPSAVLMDAKTGTVLFEKSAHEVRPCASITKVMTLILVMEAIDQKKITWNDEVTTSSHASSMGGSDIWLEPGEIMTVEEMVKATIVASANDAAVALAEHICGSEESFVIEMNKKAKSLNMKETVFKNCNGLDEDGHVTSAYDVAIMSRELLKHKEILQFSGIWMDELRDGKTQLVNTNKLLKSYQGITGLKTGTTSKAGSCISATAERNGLSLIAVVLGCSTGKDRFTDAERLLDYGFSEYSMYQVQVPQEAVREIPVIGGMEEMTQSICRLNDHLLIKKGEEAAIKNEVYLPSALEAPIEKGDVIGKLIIKNGGKQIAEYPIAAAASVKEMNFNDVMGLFLNAMAS